MMTRQQLLRWFEGIGLALVAILVLPAMANAAGPSWWVARGVLNTNLTATDYAAVNQGQVKNVASNAWVELNANLPGGAGSNVLALISSFTSTNNYLPANIGQLKYVAKPFYDRLITVGYTNAYPWSGSTTTNDYATANVGQLKNLFAWDITKDTVGDGIPDWWRQHYFGGDGSTTNGNSCASCDPDGDGYSNLQEFLMGTNPGDTNSPGLRNLFFYDNLGRLAVMIGTNGTDAGFYDYDAVGNITAIRRQTVGFVSLLEFSPVTGSGNTTITLQGTGFSPILSENTVLFGSVTAQVVSASANQLQVLVPTNAVTSLISVKTPLGVSTNSVTFTNAVGVSISPSSVTLSGTSTQQFVATVYGTTNQTVTWTLNGWVTAGMQSTWGLITTNGLYTAPINPPPSSIVTVRARSVVDSDPLKEGVAIIALLSARGPIYSPMVSAQPAITNVTGPVYSATISAQPGVTNSLGPIYSPTVSAEPYP